MDNDNSMSDGSLLYNETNDVAGMEPLIDVYTPSIIWNRSYLIPKRRFPRGQADATASYNFKDLSWRTGVSWLATTTRGLFSKRGSHDAPTTVSNERRFRVAEITGAIDKAILDFLQSEAGRDFEVDPSIDGNIVLFANVFDGQTVRRAGTPVTIDEEARSALCKRIFAADERAIVLRGEYGNDWGKYRLGIKVYLRTNLFTLSMIATPMQRTSDVDVLGDAADFNYYTTRFWDEVAERVMKPFPDRLGRADEELSAIFADSRGLVISSHSIPGIKDAQEISKTDGCWADPVIKHLAPILSPTDARNCTATYMLDKRAITVTTFGSQPTPQFDEPQPLTFVICLHGAILEEHEEGWARQMGHVMSRSHTITTMRLAALIDLKLLRITSAELATVEDLKASARDLISRYEANEVKGGAAHTAVDGLRKRLAQINSDFLEANAAGIGLTFRIEYSRYYIEEFKKNIEALQLSPIDGYQSYAQTIDRSISIIFEFISRRGVRYDRLVRETATIEKSFSTVQTRHTGNLIAELQRNGELLLIGALVPYYLIGISAHIFGAPENLQGPDASKWRVANAVIFMGCLYFAGLRFAIAKYKATKLASKSSRLIFGILFAILIGFATLRLCLKVR